MSRRNWMCPQLRVLNRITRYTTYLSASRYAKDAVPTKLVRRYVGVEQDELPSSIGLDFRARLDGGRMYSGHLEAKKRFSMMLLEHQDIIMEFCGPSRWKELSKESGSKILPYGDGSCWKAFKPIASLIA
ncbi:hypothetical protein Tco_0830856 [Tanacetum coccineum]